MAVVHKNRDGEIVKVTRAAKPSKVIYKDREGNVTKTVTSGDNLPEPWKKALKKAPVPPAVQPKPRLRRRSKHKETD